MTKKLLGIVIVSCIILAMIGCGVGKSEVGTKANNESPNSVNGEKDEVKQGMNESGDREIVSEKQNLLTGIIDLSEEAIGKRPVAIMVNNVNKALPQYGIAQADVIFEMHVEGDLTRLMALYADYTKVPKVCAVRSCRYYYPAISEGFDAIYVHWGMDESMREYVETIDSTRYDAMENGSGLFERDQSRINSGYSLEHTAYFDGTLLSGVMESQGERTELLDNKRKAAFLFNGTDEQIRPNGKDCSWINVDFGAATATFTYDKETNTYLKQINGKDQMDSVAGTQLAFTNVFILETDISVRTEYGHKQIDWQGGSNSVGYYISNGAVQKISWSKASEKDYLEFFDEKGEELSINCGKSYIAFNYAGQATFE